MGIKLHNMKDNLKVILRRDDALALDLTEEEWKNYTKDYQESFLRFIPNCAPTRWILKKQLNWGAQKNLNNEKIGVGADGKVEVKMGHMLEDIRYALVDIENPTYYTEEEKVVFKKDSDGYADKDLILTLETNGIVNELYNARQSAISEVGNIKK